MSEPGSTDRQAEDAKAWFYLDHRQDIEAWRLLRPLGSDLLHRYLVNQVETLEEWADELSAEFESDALDAGSTPRAGFFRPAWQANGMAGLSVVIEWDRTKLLTAGGLEWPYVAVRWPVELAGDDRRLVVRDALKGVRTNLKGLAGGSHPFWRPITPLLDQPVDPEAIAKAAVESLRELWLASASTLDQLTFDTGPAASPIAAL